MSKDILSAMPQDGTISWGSLWRKCRHLGLTRYGFNEEVRSLIASGKIAKVNARLSNAH